jgi:class 3 adenylate cyclase
MDTILESCPVAIVVIDMDMNVVYQNSQSRCAHGVCERLPHLERLAPDKVNTLVRHCQRGQTWSTSIKGIGHFGASSLAATPSGSPRDSPKSGRGSNSTVQLRCKPLGEALIIAVYTTEAPELKTGSPCRSMSLLNIMQLAGPRSKSPPSQRYSDLVVVFADIVGYTSMCVHVPPDVVMQRLTKLYTAFDNALAEHTHLTRYEIAGDCYVVYGQPMSSVDIKDVVAEAVDFARCMHCVAAGMTPRLLMRVGIHVGPATSGTLECQPSKFMLFGDTINVASRLQTTASPGSTQISTQVFALLDPANRTMWRLRTKVHMKGLGNNDTWVRNESPPASGELPPATADDAAACALDDVDDDTREIRRSLTC